MPPAKPKHELKPVGQPTKFNRKVAAKILESIRVGLYMEAAAAINDINKDTLYLWLKKHPKFSDDVLKAHGEADDRDLKRIDEAAEGYEVIETKTTTDKNGNITEIVTKCLIRREWTAAAWRLERRNRRKFGRYQHDDDVGDNHIEIVRRQPQKRILEIVEEDKNGSNGANSSSDHGGNGHG